MPNKRTTTKAAAAEAAKTTTPVSTEEISTEKAEQKAKTTEKKQPVKRAAAKKTAATRKTAAKKAEVKKEVFIQFAGKETTIDTIESNVKNAWMAETGKKESDIREVQIYIKPEENAVYYVINGEFVEGGQKIEL